METMRVVLQVLETTAFVCVCIVMIQLWRMINRPPHVKKKSFLPAGSFGLPILGETVAYMKSMKMANPTFMAEHRERQVS